MTVKQIFRWIGGGIVAFLFAILGIQRKKISKQKEEIKEQAAEIKTEKKKVEVKDLEVTTIKEVTENEKKLDEKEATKHDKPTNQLYVEKKALLRVILFFCQSREYQSPNL